MASRLASLPPELVLRIGEVADYATLCSLLRGAKFLYFLLWPVLYRREIAHNPVGFIRCIRAGAVTAVDKFIAAGVDVNVKVDMGDLQDFTGYTYPLATATVRRQKDIVDVLLKNGADVEAEITGILCYVVLADNLHPWAGVMPNTPLSVAVTMGHDDIAVELVRKMKNPDALIFAQGRRTEYTALEQAVLCLRPDVVRQLLARVADPNNKPRTAQPAVLLHDVLKDRGLRAYINATTDGEDLFSEVIMALLEYGADPFVKRECRVHLEEPEKCGRKCGLTACAAGVDSPYEKVRRHFMDLAHRRVCERLACRASRCDYAVRSEDVPGHCGADWGVLFNSASWV